MSAITTNNNKDEEEEKIDFLSPDKSLSQRKEFNGFPKRLDFSKENMKNINLSFDAIEEIDLKAKNQSAVVGYAASNNTKTARHSQSIRTSKFHSEDALDYKA